MANPVQDLEPIKSDSVQGTVTTTESTKKKFGGPMSVCAMHKLVKNIPHGQKYKVIYNECGIPIGSTRYILQSYVGMLARHMVPIDMSSWPNVSSDLKEKIRDDVQVIYSFYNSLVC